MERSLGDAMTRRNRRLPFVAAFFVGAVVAGIAWTAVVTNREESPAQNLGLFDPRIEPTELLRGGERVNLAEAEARVGFDLLRPQDDVASDASISEVWILTGETTEAALRYESGLRIYLTVWPTAANPRSFYEELARDSGVGRVLEINGFPAFSVGKDEQAQGYPADSVVLVSIGNVEVSLHADMPIDELVNTAMTVGTG